MRLSILLFAVIAVFISLPSTAQTFAKSNLISPRAAVVYPSQITEDYNPVLQHLEMPKPGGQSERSRLMELKEQRAAGRSVTGMKNSADPHRLNPPAVLKNFEGNIYNARVPNDNDLAISNGGKLISVINSTIFAFDVNQDSLLGTWSLSAFASSLGVTQSMFDPKVEYDPGSDRFVMIWLAGFLDSTSRIIIAFSQTGDPMQAWNLYDLPGNPLNNNTWSDYPVTGLSAYELFIGMNTFTNGSTNNSGFTESCLWQICLRDGFNGNPLTTRYYNNILQQGKAIFNICPVPGGSQPYGPDFYCLSNRNLDATNDTLFLLHVTDTIGGPAEGLQVNTLLVNEPYYIPPTARQALNHTFDTNDSRILGAFYENNKVQFVQSCEDTTTGYAAVYHGIISNPGSTPVVSGKILGDTLLDLGFPNISYAGVATGDDAAIISVNHTAPSVYSGISAFNFDGMGYSPLIKVKEGLNWVNVLGGFYERWGDYSGSQRRYNEPGVVWIAGSYGRSNRTHGTWIAELTRYGVSQPGVKEEAGEQMHLYPNPAGERVQIDFHLIKSQTCSFEVYDMQGRQVILLMEEFVKQGSNHFGFDVSPLATGTYLLIVKSGGKPVFTEKFIRQ